MPDDNKLRVKIVPKSTINNNLTNPVKLKVPEYNIPLVEKNTPIEHKTFSDENTLNLKEDIPNYVPITTPYTGTFWLDTNTATDPKAWISAVNQTITGVWEAAWGFLGGLATNPPKDPELEKVMAFEKQSWNEFTPVEKREVYKKFKQVDEGFKESLDSIIPLDPKYAQSFWVSDVPKAVGQTFGFAATGYIFGPMAPFITGSKVQSYYQGQDAIDYGASDEALLGTELYGSLIGLSEGLPIAHGMGKLGKLGKLLAGELDKGASIVKKAGSKEWLKAIGQSLGQGLEEGIQESGQTIAENFTAQELYDGSRELFEGVDRGGGAGFVSGMGLQLLYSAVGIKMHDHRVSKAERELAKQTREYIRNGIEQNLREVNKEKTKLKQRTYDPLADVIQTLNVIEDFGSNSNPTLKSNDQKLMSNGLIHVKENEVSSVANTLKKLEDYDNPNLVAALYLLGVENTRRFYEGVNKNNEGKKIVANKHIVNREGLFGVSKETFSDLTKQVYDDMVSLGMYNNVLGDINLSELKSDLTNQQLEELIRDMTVATTMNFGDNGLELLRQKWATILGEKADLIHDITSQLVQFNQENRKEMREQVNSSITKMYPKLRDEIYQVRARELEDLESDLSQDLETLNFGENKSVFEPNITPEQKARLKTMEENAPVLKGDESFKLYSVMRLKDVGAKIEGYGLTLNEARAKVADLFADPENAGMTEIETEDTYEYYLPSAEQTSPVAIIYKPLKEQGVYEPQFEPLVNFTEPQVQNQPQAQVTKVISGGQTGIDQIGLMVGKELGIQTGGTAAPGFATEYGANLRLTEYGLKEILPEIQAQAKTDREFWLPRTEENVINSDGTVYFSESASSAGRGATERYAKKHNKPFIFNPTVEELKQWLITNNIKILNVAGNRASKMGQSFGVKVRKLLTDVLSTKISTGQKEVLKANENLAQSQEPTYGELLDGFKGTTVKELFQFLKKKSLSETEEFSTLEKLVLNLVGDYPVSIEQIVNNERGMFDGIRAVINPNAQITTQEGYKRNPYRTLLHESTHALLRQFLRQKNVRSTLFTRQIRSIMDEVIKYVQVGPTAMRSSFSTEQATRDNILQFYKSELEYYLSIGTHPITGEDYTQRDELVKVEEFLTGFLTDTGIMQLVLSQIGTSGLPIRQSNLFKRVTNNIAAAIFKVFGVTKGERTLTDELLKLFEGATADIIYAHKSRIGSLHLTDQELRNRYLSKVLVSDDPEADNQLFDVDNFENSDDEEHTNTELSDDEAPYEELLSVVAFSNYLAKLARIDAIEFNEMIKKIPSDKFITYLETQVLSDALMRGEFDAKLTSLWNSQYRQVWGDYKVFKEEFLLNMHSKARNSFLKEHLSISMDKRPGEDELGRTSPPTVNSLPSRFRSTEGTWTNSLVNQNTLEQFLPKLAQVMGIDLSQLDLAYINDFTVVDVFGKSKSYNLQSTGKTPLGKDEESMGVFQDITFALNSVQGNIKYQFIGNFADKNTLPVIRIELYKGQKTNVYNYERFLRELSNAYAKQSPAYAKIAGTESLSLQAPYLMRMLMEDLWYNANITRDEAGQLIIESKVIDKDFNKIMKRGVKWVHDQRFALIDNEQRLGRLSRVLPKGIVRDEKGELSARTAILDEAALDQVIKITEDSEPITLREALINALGTPLTDGASFYLIGSFDITYQKAFALVKPGVYKNIITSDSSMKPLLIKHAMYGISARSPLGQWMSKNGLALLATEGGTKIGKESYGTISLSELQEGVAKDDKRIFNIPFRRIARLREMNSQRLLAGRPRQFFNASGMDVESNPAIQDADPSGKLGKYISGVLTNHARIANGIYSTFTYPKLLETLKNIINEPVSPAEANVASILMPIFINNPDTFETDYGYLLHHPLVAQLLRNRLGKPIDNMLSDHLPGARVTYMPSIGWLNKKAESDIVTNDNNLHTMILTEGSITLLKTAIPDDNIRENVLTLIRLQRKVAQLRYRAFIYKQDLTFEIEKTKTEIQATRNYFLERLKDHLVEEKVNLDKTNEEAVRKFEEFKEYLENGIKDYNNFIMSSHPDIIQWKKTRINEMIDKRTGRLKNGWVLIPQDVANREGIKAGDKGILINTPTDFTLAVSSERVAGIVPCYGSRRLVDPGTIIVNSERAQTVRGKDFDGDQASFMISNPDYWTMEVDGEVVDGFEKLWDILKKAEGSYEREMIASMRRVIPEGELPIDPATGQSIEINKETIYDKRLRLKYAQIKMGTVQATPETVFPGFGKDFYKVNEAYVDKAIGIIVSERLQHGILSALNFRSSVKIKDKTIPLKVRHDNWFDSHHLHAIMTHHYVDFPNNTDKLFYDSDTRSPGFKNGMFAAFFGLTNDEVKLFEPYQIEAWIDFRLTVFLPIFRLIRGNRDYHSLVRLYLEVKPLLEALSTNNWQAIYEFYRQKKMAGLDLLEKRRVAQKAWLKNDPYNLYKEMYSSRNWTEKKLVFIKELLDNAQVDDINNVPTLNKIKTFDITKVPVPGAPLETHLINQAKAVLSTIGEIPEIEAALLAKQKEAKTKADFQNIFLSRTRGKYGERAPYDIVTDRYQSFDVDGAAIAASHMLEAFDYALKRKEKGRYIVPLENSLDFIRKELVAINQTLDEIKSSEDVNLQYDNSVTAAARAAVFPFLFEKLLSRPAISGRIGDIGKTAFITPSGDTLVMALNNHGRLVFAYKTFIFTQTEIRDALTNIKDNPSLRTQMAAELFNVLTSRNSGFWNSPVRRLALTNPQGIEVPGPNNTLVTQGLGISLKLNLTLEDREDITRQVLVNDLYSNSNFSINERKAVWLSLIIQPSLAASGEGRAINLTGFTRPGTEDAPLRYSNNGMILRLMSEFEPTLSDSYWGYYSNYSASNPIDRPDLVGHIHNVYEPNFEHAEVTSEVELRNTVYDYLKELTSNRRSRSSQVAEYIKIRKRIDGKPVQEQYNIIREEILAALNDQALLAALSQEGEWGLQVLKDLKKMSRTAFSNKYSRLIPAKLDRVIGDLMESWEHGLEERWDKISSVLPGQSDLKVLHDIRAEHKIRRGLALYWTTVGALKSSYRKPRKHLEKTAVIRTFLRNRLSWETWGGRYGKKIFGNEPLAEQVDFILPMEGGHPIVVSAEDVLSKDSIYRHKNLGYYNIATLSSYKTQWVNLALRQWGAIMSQQLERSDSLLALLSKKKNRDSYREDYGKRKQRIKDDPTRMRFIVNQLADLGGAQIDQPTWELHARLVDVLERFPQLTKIRLYPHGVHDVIFQVEDRTYTNVYEMIEAEFTSRSGFEKLAVLAALDQRYMFDILVPKYMESVIHYLDATIERLLGMKDYISAREVQAMRERHFKEYKSFEKRKGTYYPHELPKGAFKEYWMNQNLQRIIKRMEDIQILERQRAEAGKRPLTDLGPKTRKELAEIARKELERNWTTLYSGNTGPFIIPHMLQRQQEWPEFYNKIEPQVAYNYINELITGFKNDLLGADYRYMRALGKRIGESPGVMQKLKHFYADQGQNKFLHTAQIDRSKVKPGMAIQFYSDVYIREEDLRDPDLPTLQPASVWGTVRKVTKEGIELDIDVYNTLAKVERDLERYLQIADNISQAPDFVQNRFASARQINTLMNLKLQGYVNLSDQDILNRTVREASEEIITALDKIRENPALLGKYSWDKIYNFDEMGRPNQMKVNRLVHVGAVEYLQAKARELNTLAQLDGKWGAMRAATWGMLKASTYSLTKVNNLKKLFMLQIMGFTSGPAAAFTNAFGAFSSCIIDAPKTRWKHFKNAQAWRNLLKDPLRNIPQNMNEDEAMFIYNLLSAMSLRKSNVLSISLEAGGITEQQILEAPGEGESWGSKRKAQLAYLINYWKQASGFALYQKELDRLQQIEMSSDDALEISNARLRQNRLAQIWRGKIFRTVTGYPSLDMKDVLKMSDVEHIKLVMQTMAIEQEWKNKGITLPQDMPNQAGLSQQQILKLLFKKIAKWLYAHPILGVGLQGKAEILRVNNMYIDYVMAQDAGYTKLESIQHALNSVSAWHANYGNADTQFAAHTVMGKLAMQYTHYSFNAWRAILKALQNVIPQMIEHSPRGWQVIKLRRMPVFIAPRKAIFALFQTNIDWADKMLNQLERNPETFQLRDINIIHGLTMKMMWGLVFLTAANRLFPNLVGPQNPVIQALWTAMNSLWDLLSSVDWPWEDEEDTLKDPKTMKVLEDTSNQILSQQVFFGLFWKYLMTAPFNDGDNYFDQLANTYLSGRTQRQIEFFSRLDNTILAAKDRKHMEDMLSWYRPGVEFSDLPTKEQKKTLLEPKYFFKMLTTFDLLGYQPSYEKRKDTPTYEVEDPLRGLRTVKARMTISPSDEDLWLSAEDRVFELFNPRTYFPMLNRIIGP